MHESHIKRLKAAGGYDRDSDEPSGAPALRAAMVADLRRLGAVCSDGVARALGRVPRHVFAGGASLEDAYAADRPVVTKRDDAGVALSALSSAHIQASMLEQARITPGMRVLEIGSGGYNAALIAELVGAAGEVTSVDIDAEVVDRARACLAAAGYGRVRVTLADAEDGVSEHSRYDRVIVTVGAWDIPPAWREQLTARGRLVVPLRMRGLTRSVAFDRDGDRLVSDSYRLCGFVPMRGAGTHADRVVLLDGDDVRLHVDDLAQPVDAEGLRAALVGPRVERWSGVEFDHVDELDLWMATSARASGMLRATEAAVQCRRLRPAAALRGLPVVVSGRSFAHDIKRPIDETDRFETGVHAYGPDAESLADEYVDRLRIWDNTYRCGQQAQITVHPSGAPTHQPAEGCVIDKRHTRVVISWPA